MPKYNYETLFIIFFKPQITDGYFVCRIAFNCNNANISASRGLVGGDIWIFGTRVLFF